MGSQETDEMLRINRDQRAYYEAASGYGENSMNNTLTNLWRRMKIRAFAVFKDTDRTKFLKSLHRQWIGDISNAKVLDLGCGAGNPLSLEIATGARGIFAIDLSESALSVLQLKLVESGLS